MKRLGLLLLALMLTSAVAVAPPAPADHDGEDEPPSEVPDLRLTTPYELREGTVNVNTTPTWAWDAATDDHGVDHYEVTETHYGTETSETTQTTDELSYRAQTTDDGYVCIEVNAVDTAGQAGPTTFTYCVFLDTVDPENTFAHPQPSSLYLATDEIVDVTPMAGVDEDATYALGDLTLRLESDDRGEVASGLYSARLSDLPRGPLAGDPVARSCENEFGQPGICEWTDTTAGVAAEHFVGETEDEAGNLAEVHTNYTMVDVVAVERPTSDETRAMVHWEPYEGEDFARYEVYAVQEDGFGAAAPARLVASIEDPRTVSAVDDVPDVGETWTYHQVTYTATAGLGVEAHAPTHPTTLAFASEDGRVSVPEGCTPGGVCPFVHT